MESTRICREVPHGGQHYQAMLRLRDAQLRAPLGLTYSPQELAAEADSMHLGCWQGEQLLGCLVLKPTAGGGLRLRQMAVASAHQRQGIGRELVTFAEASAYQRGFREIRLHAREHALPFYTKLGYTTEGPRFVEVTLPHFHMRKALIPR